MTKVRRNDACPCGSGRKYKNCCFDKDYLKIAPDKKLVEFTLEDGTKTATSITSIDSIPAHNKNGLSPNITPEQMMDLCLDKIHTILESESVGMAHDLVDKVILNMDIIPTFTYRQITQRMISDGRFEVIHNQICGLKGTDPLEFMAEKLEK